MTTPYQIKVTYGCDFVLLAFLFVFNTYEYLSGNMTTVWYDMIVSILVVITGIRIYWMRQRLAEVGK